MDDEVIGLVPAAGEGNRLYPFSRAVPKEMYPILGKAVIEHCIENLKEGGVKKIHIIVGHQKGAIMDYIGDGSFFGVNVSYMYQFKRRGLGHAILQAKNWVHSPFVTLLGDSFIEPKHEIKDLIELHKKMKPVATILLFQVEDPTGYGIVKLGSVENGVGDIEKVIEKPGREQAAEYARDGKYYAICGAYVFDPRIFDYIERTPPGANSEIQITDAVGLALQNNEKAFGLVLKGRYMDIGKWKTVLNVEREFTNKSDIEDHIKEREDMMRKVREAE